MEYNFKGTDDELREITIMLFTWLDKTDLQELKILAKQNKDTWSVITSRR